MLDAAKVADTVLLLPSMENGIDDYGDYCLTCLFAQGLPATLVAVQVTKINSGDTCDRWSLYRDWESLTKNM